MSSGIFIPALIQTQALTRELIVTSGNDFAGASAVQSSIGPWQPSQWAKPALTVISVVNTSQQASGNPANANQPSTTDYIFRNPAVIRASHRRTIRATSHPVLTGANITDHAYVEPAGLTLEILASDSMATLQNGAWIGWPTAGLTAWQVLKALQINRTLLTVTTRLDTYTNMIIMECTTNDDVKTLHGLRATVVFREIIAASASSQSTVSARGDATIQNPQGIVQGSAADPSQVAQHVIPSASYPNVQTYPQIPGAGDISSNSLGQLATTGTQ